MCLRQTTAILVAVAITLHTLIWAFLYFRTESHHRGRFSIQVEGWKAAQTDVRLQVHFNNEGHGAHPHGAHNTYSSAVSNRISHFLEELSRRSSHSNNPPLPPLKIDPTLPTPQAPGPPTRPAPKASRQVRPLSAVKTVTIEAGNDIEEKAEAMQEDWWSSLVQAAGKLRSKSHDFDSKVPPPGSTLPPGGKIDDSFLDDLSDVPDLPPPLQPDGNPLNISDPASIRRRAQMKLEAAEHNNIMVFEPALAVCLGTNSVPQLRLLEFSWLNSTLPARYWASVYTWVSSDYYNRIIVPSWNREYIHPDSDWDGSPEAYTIHAALSVMDCFRRLPRAQFYAIVEPDVALNWMQTNNLLSRYHQREVGAWGLLDGDILHEGFILLSRQMVVEMVWNRRWLACHDGLVKTLKRVPGAGEPLYTAGQFFAYCARFLDGKLENAEGIRKHLPVQDPPICKLWQENICVLKVSQLELQKLQVCPGA